MKELIFISILFVIAGLIGFTIGWLARDWKVEKTDLEELTLVIRSTMKEEFRYQETIGNVFYNDDDYALRKKD